MRIAVIGTGYVGLVTGTCFAETGNQVTCIDIDEHKVTSLSNGIITIYEPGLEPIFLRNRKQGRLRFVSDLADGIKGADIIFLALPTPPHEDGSADLSYVLNAAADLAEHIEKYTVIVDKSTVPVGTSEKVTEVIGRTLDGSKFDVVSNPEFLREGVAVQDFMKPDRVVVGSSSDRAKEIMRKLYLPFVRQGNPIIFMDERSAELTKYAGNAYLATRISFMNEMANLCERIGADIDMVRKGIGTDRRIGRHFLYAGIGYGGSCFPKDVSALRLMAQHEEYEFGIIDSVVEVNRKQKLVLMDKLRKYFDRKLSGMRIAVWGLSFKPNTDDIREAPSLSIIGDLLEAGVSVSVFDPAATSNFRAKFGDALYYGSDMYDVLDDAHALCILTEWSVFRMPDFDQMARRMKNKVIFDGRNLYDPHTMVDSGFYYESIGRQIVGENMTKHNKA